LISLTLQINTQTKRWRETWNCNKRHFL